MRVLFVCNNAPPLFGGAGQRAVRQAQHLAADGYEVGILAPAGATVPVGIQLFEIPEFRFPDRQPVLSLALAAARMPHLFAGVWKAISRFDPDVVHCIPVGSVPAMIAVLAGRLRGCTTIVETTLVGDDDLVSLRKGRLGWLKTRAFMFVDVVVNISPLLESLTLAQGVPPARSRVIGNGVDVEKFRPVSESQRKAVRRKLALPEEAYIVANVGIVRPRKGTAEIVRAFGRSPIPGEKGMLVLVGPTDKDAENRTYVSHVRKLTGELGVADQVVFTGQVGNVHEWLQASDAFVFASTHEGFGTALVEAMSVGLPVVACQIPGITDYIITDGVDGILVGRFEELQEALSFLIADRDRRTSLGEQARVTALARFSDAVVMKQYRELYEDSTR